MHEGDILRPKRDMIFWKPQSYFRKKTHTRYQTNTVQHQGTATDTKKAARSNFVQYWEIAPVYFIETLWPRPVNIFFGGAEFLVLS